MSTKTKLELTWIGKENRPKLEPRFFNDQDDVDRRREQLIAEIEGKLQQRVSERDLFSIRYSLEFSMIPKFIVPSVIDRKGGA